MLGSCGRRMTARTAPTSVFNMQERPSSFLLDFAASFFLPQHDMQPFWLPPSSSSSRFRSLGFFICYTEERENFFGVVKKRLRMEIEGTKWGFLALGSCGVVLRVGDDRFNDTKQRWVDRIGMKLEGILGKIKYLFVKT